MSLFRRAPTGPAEVVRSDATCLDGLGPFGGEGQLTGFEDGTVRWKPYGQRVYVDCGHASGLRSPESGRLIEDHPASIVFTIGEFRPVLISPDHVPTWRPFLLRHNSRLRLPEEGAVNPAPRNPEDLLEDFKRVDQATLYLLLVTCRKARTSRSQVGGDQAGETEMRATRRINESIPQGKRDLYTVLDYERALEMALEGRGRP